MIRIYLNAAAALLLGGLAGCVATDFAGVQVISVDPYDGSILEITTAAAAPVGTVPADQLPLRDGQVNAQQTHAFVQNAAKLKVVSLREASEPATLDHVVSARWAPDGAALFVVLDAASFGNDVFEIRVVTPELATVRSARLRAPGFRKLVNQGLAISWSVDGRLVAFGPREDRTGWTMVDPSKLGPADAPAVFVVDAESLQRTGHPGYHSAYFLGDGTLVAGRGDRVLLVSSEFKELATLDVPPGRLVGSDPQRGFFVLETTLSHLSLNFGAREYWLYSYPSMKKARLPRGGPSLTFLHPFDPERPTEHLGAAP